MYIYVRSEKHRILTVLLRHSDVRYPHIFVPNDPFTRVRAASNACYVMFQPPCRRSTPCQVRICIHVCDMTHVYMCHDSLTRVPWTPCRRSHIMPSGFNTLQHTATNCNKLQQTATHCITLQRTATHCNTLTPCQVRMLAVCCSVLHCVALCCTVLHCVALCCSVCQLRMLVVCRKRG